MNQKFDLKISTTGLALGHDFMLVVPNNNEVEQFIESALAKPGLELKGQLSVTKSAGGYLWTATAILPEVNEHPSINITQAASGAEALLEGLIIGTGKTWTATLSLVLAQ